MSEKSTSCDGMFFKVEMGKIRDGILAKVGFDGWTTLCAIASFMNEKGECYPSQDTLANLLGVTRQTVNKKIANLTATTLEDGSPILEKRLFNMGMGTRAFYTINPNCGLSFGKGNVNESRCNVSVGAPTIVNEVLHEEESLKQDSKQDIKQHTRQALTAKDVVSYFCKKFETTYNVKYTPNYRRDCSMIKTKLMKSYDVQTIQAIIDVVFDEYDQRWKNPKFPRPSIGQLCSWLPNEALAILDARKEENAETDAAIKDSERYLSEGFTEKLFNAAFGSVTNE